MKNNLITGTFVLAGFALGFAGCKDKEAAVTSTPVTRGEVEIVEFCSGPEYLTNGEYFRASATGTSPQREIAKKIARQNAESALARSIEFTVEAVAENQATQLGYNTTEEATSKFNELSRTIVNKKINGAVTICQKLTQTPEGKYISYIAVELSGQEIADEYVNSLQSEERIRAEYNYDQFKETFENVMESYRQ